MNFEMHDIMEELWSSYPGRKTLRFPSELEPLLEREAKKGRVDISQMMRHILIFYYLPELLSTQLNKEATEWITTQGKECIEIHFGRKIETLQKIKDLAEYAIEETKNIQQKFLDAEVEGLDKISAKLSEELK